MRFKSKEGSLKSTSKISNVLLVLKEASGCWADVPRHKKSQEETAYEQQYMHGFGYNGYGVERTKNRRGLGKPFFKW